MDIGIQMKGSMGKLAHEVAVVTEASKGIGAEIAPGWPTGCRVTSN
jgi:hypothetical protein